MKKQQPLEAVVVVGDRHAGSTCAPMPPDNWTTEGNSVQANKTQRWLYERWIEFTQGFVPDVLKGRPYILVDMGDMIEGCHHGSKQVVSALMKVQRRISVEMIRQLRDGATKFYVVKGTECHTGEDEDEIGRELGAEKDPETGEHAAMGWVLSLCGKLHSFKHHIGTSGRLGLYATQLSINLAEEQAQCVRFGQPVPSVVVRGHRHTYGLYRDETSMAITTPAWQVLTRHAHKVVPSSVPGVGGLILDYQGVAPGGLPVVRERIYRQETSKAVRV